MPLRTCCICTRCAADLTRCWRARDASNWPALALISCRIAFCLISEAGRSKTSSRINCACRGRGIDFASRTGRPDAMSDFLMAEKRVREATGSADLAVARRVIRAEICGLESLAEALDGAFEAAVDTCAAARGRIVVAGLGKSGHIARKIAATLASTGTPAQFVHPVEASHGDLGMIGSEDAVLALSNSGETTEFADIVAYSRRCNIPLIAITGGVRSTLAAAADVVLLLPAVAEACPMGLAPTTSTTMMAALGDALALALLERKGFSSADFRLYHPGGRLGR